MGTKKRGTGLSGISELESDTIGNNVAAASSTLGNTLSSFGNIFDAISLDPKLVESGPFGAEYAGNADMANYYNQKFNDAMDAQKAMRDEMYREQITQQKEDSAIADKMANQQQKWSATNRQLTKAGFNDAVMKNLADRARTMSTNNQAIGDMFVGLWGA